MKKQFLFLYIALIISTTFGMNVDYGASIDSFFGSNISSESYVFGFEKLSLYSSLQVSNNLSLAVDGFYKFSYNSTSMPDDPNTFDFTILLASFSVGNTKFLVGRNTLADYGGDIFSHVLDGVSFTLPLGFATLIGNAGYSGLVNIDEVSIFTTSNDEDTINRVIEGADLVKEFDKMSIWASFYAYQDIDSLGSNLSFYFGGGFNGTIKDDIFYGVRGNMQVGQFQYIDNTTSDISGSSVLSGMGVATISWFINSDNPVLSSLSPFISADFGMSSGDSDLSTTEYGSGHDEDLSDGINLYSPMVSGGPGTIYSVNNQNLTYLKLLASVSPLKNLQTQLGSTIFFRTVEGPTSDSSLDSDASGNYMGLEISLTGNYRPFSDLGVSGTAGVFFPDGTVLDTDPSGMLSIYLSLSL